MKSLKFRVNSNYRLVIVFFFTLFMPLFYGCAVGKRTTEVMNAWKGRNISEVIQSWGPETRTSSDGKGGVIYTWITTWSTIAYVDTGGTYQPPRNLSCRQSFYVNRNGIIYSWQWEGNCR